MKAPHARLLQLTATFLVVFYMLFIGGTFDATVRFRVQLLNAVAGVVLAALWLVVRLRQRARLRATGLEWPVLVFVLTQWVATATSAQPRLSLEAVVNISAWAIAFVVLCDLLASGWPRQYVTNALLGVAAILAFQALWEVGVWFAQWAALGQLPPTAFRLTGWLGHPNLTAAVLNLLMPLVLARWMTAAGRAARTALGALCLAMLAAEFFTSSRAGWIACAVTLGLFAALALWERRMTVMDWLARARGAPLWLRGLSLALMLAALTASGWLLVRQTQHPSHNTNIISSRRGFWLPAWQLFLAHPLIGVGPDLFAWFYPAIAVVPVPPNEVVPHAHSLIFQILTGSGVVGMSALLALGAMGVWQGWQRWRFGRSALWGAAFSASLIGAVVHHLFDYFFTAPIFTFVFVLIAACAFSSNTASPPKNYPPARLAGPAFIIMALAAYFLHGAMLNDQAVLLAAEGRWAEAAPVFERAAQADPDFPLYWIEAAQASTRAGNFDAGLHLWQRAALADPHWSVWPVTIAVLTRDTDWLSLPSLAPDNPLFRLNEGVLYEERGEQDAAQAAYRHTLDLNPNQAHALFWSQTPLRAEVLAAWQATRPKDESPLARGWAALEAGHPTQALELFEQARAANPLSNVPYVGLVRAAWASNDEVRAAMYLRVGSMLPVYEIWETLDLQLLQGDWAAAHGDRVAAMAAYTAAFSAFNDYGSAGPGSFGYPQRNWFVFHRVSLPTDLLPEFAHADITEAMDERFAQLAQWYTEAGQTETACLILNRIYREAPLSASGHLHELLCP